MGFVKTEGVPVLKKFLNFLAPLQIVFMEIANQMKMMNWNASVYMDIRDQIVTN